MLLANSQLDNNRSRAAVNENKPGKRLHLRYEVTYIIGTKGHCQRPKPNRAALRGLTRLGRDDGTQETARS